MSISIQDSEIARAVSKHFPGGRWEFEPNQEEELSPPIEPIQLTDEEQEAIDELCATDEYDTMDREGWLFYAVWIGNRELIEYFLDKENVNVRDKNGATPLHWAAKYGNDQIGSIEIVKLLVSEGANVDARNKYGETPLHWVLDELYEIVDRKQSVKYFDWGFQVVQLLITAGADARAEDNCGYTPLGTAMAIGNTEVVECLSGNAARFRK